MGLNTGAVVVGKIGDNLRMDYTAVGDTTNVASRLQALAEPATMRISEATQRAAHAYFEFKALGKHALKGIAEPVPVFDLVGPLATEGVRPQFEGIGSPLVGRGPELATLSASLDALCEGHGSVGILTGEPGAGKIAVGRRSQTSRRYRRLALARGPRPLVRPQVG
jgi:hypothetical protein